MKSGLAGVAELDAVFDSLKGLPFWCSTVAGGFTHIGTATLFRELVTAETEFSRPYAVRQRLGVKRQPGLRSAGVVNDSVLSGGGDLGPATVVLRCGRRTAPRGGCPSHATLAIRGSDRRSAGADRFGRRLREPVVRCIAEGEGTAEYRYAQGDSAAVGPGERRRHQR